MKRFTLLAIIFILLFSGRAPSAFALGVLDELLNELNEDNTAKPAVNTPSVPYEEIKPGQTRQKAKDEIARLEKMPAQIDEMLRQAWEAGRTQTDTVITTPYGNVTIKFNLAEILKQRYTGDGLAVRLNNYHGEMIGNELRINNDGSWKNKTYEGMKATITHELGHYMDRRTTKSPDNIYRTSIDFSEIEADAFAMRYLGRSEYSEMLKKEGNVSQDYINAVIKRMEEMVREDNETLAGLRAIADARTEAAAQQEAAKQDTARKEADAARKAGEARQAAAWEAARKEAARLAELDPKTHVNRGNSYMSSDSDKAIASFNEAIRLDPNFSDAYYYRASAYEKKADLDKAFADYTEVIRLGNEKWKEENAYSRRAYISKQKGDFDNAIADYTEAIRLNPTRIFGYYDRADAYNKKGDYDKAIADYTEAIRLNPSHIYDADKIVSAYSNRAGEYIKRNKRGDYDKAMADYNEAIRINPKSASAYSERGWAYFQKRKYTEARADANAALQINPNFHRAKDLDAELKKKRR